MLKKCDDGHMYDDLKYDDCPCCKGNKLSTDYEGCCGNCHKHIGDDKYCRYCGTKKGEGKFEPYENFMPCVYGSPEQMSGIYGKKKIKNKKWLFGLLVVLGVSVCIVLLILILLNL